MIHIRQTRASIINRYGRRRTSRYRRRGKRATRDVNRYNFTTRRHGTDRSHRRRHSHTRMIRTFVITKTFERVQSCHQPTTNVSRQRRIRPMRAGATHRHTFTRARVTHLPAARTRRRGRRNPFSRHNTTHRLPFRSSTRRVNGPSRHGRHRRVNISRHHHHRRYTPHPSTLLRTKVRHRVRHYRGRGVPNR